MNTEETFCGYFAAGAKKDRLIGVELEHFVLCEDDGVCPYEYGTKRILEGLAQKFELTNIQDGYLIGMGNDDYVVSIEPGAQIEVSVSPKKNAAQICAAFEDFYNKIEPELKKCGVRLATFGALEKQKVEKIPLIPKKRYEYMDKYFAKIGEYGRYMMRATASCQVSVDYADEADFVRKFRAAYLLSPVLSLLAENGGEGGLFKRIEIWNGVDSARTGIPADLFDESFGFKSYAEYIMDTPAIFMPKSGYTGSKKIGDILKNAEIDDGILEHCLSMVFPDVRLKKYIEIRVGDAMEYKKAAAYGAFVAAVLYRGADAVLEYFKGAEVEDIKAAKLAVHNNGANAEIYGKPIREAVKFIAETAPEEYLALKKA